MTCCQCQGIECRFDQKTTTKKLKQYRQNGSAATTRLLVEALMAEGTASGGMIPKVKACLKALSGAASTCIIIDGRRPHALLNEIEDGGSGTTIKK